jgi:microcystin-dependent protein
LRISPSVNVKFVTSVPSTPAMFAPVMLSSSERAGVRRATRSRSTRCPRIPTWCRPGPARRTTPAATTPAPSKVLSSTSTGQLYAPFANVQPMSAQAVGSVGGSQPHSNLMPYTVIGFCIALQGIFPSRN